jgi:hypothetical protein
MNTRYNTGTRNSTYNKTTIYNTNASSTMAPRKTSYSLDLRNSTSYNINARTAAPYHAASNTGTSKTSKVPYQATTAYQIPLSNSTVANQIATGTNTTQITYGTNANSVAYNVGTRQLECSLPSVTLDLNTIAKLIAPQQVIYNMSTGAASVVNQKATSITTTRPSNSQVSDFNTNAESVAPETPSSKPPNSLMLTLDEAPVAQKEVPIKLSECKIPSSTSSTKQSNLQIGTSTNNMTSFKTPPSGRFARPATLKPASNAGLGNVFVKTRPNTVVRAELIKNKTTKRAEPVNSVSRTKDDEYKAGKKPKTAFKTKLVNKYCTYYHKYGKHFNINFQIFLYLRI